MDPGIYRDISNDDYHGGPGDSKSGLDLVRKSPAHLRGARTGEVKREPTPAQILGTAFHCAVLEPGRFEKEYALPFTPPENCLRTIDDIKTALDAAGVTFKRSSPKPALEEIARAELPDTPLHSDLLAAYFDEHRGATILDPESYARVISMRDAVHAHPTASKLFAMPGEAELSCYWRHPVIDPVTGANAVDADGKPADLLMRCRPDWLTHSGFAVDLKSTQPDHAAPEEFARSLLGWRYHVQHALYLSGIASALAAMVVANPSRKAWWKNFQRPRAFFFVAVEDNACVVDGVAKGVAVYQLQPDSVALGESEIVADVHRLWQCYQSSKWPGYADTIQPIELPAYAFTQAAIRQGAAAQS